MSKIEADCEVFHFYSLYLHLIHFEDKQQPGMSLQYHGSKRF